MFIWKNRQAAVNTAVHLYLKGFTIESACERVLGIEDERYYNFFCTGVERIPYSQLVQFETDVIDAIKKIKERKERVLYA
ncbi:hypothetical protein [Aeribacillus pallidus]|uniref:hypothetical protein n=1 Tax=Aeribacillus pallidus TaxID=33936 RepID=UPI003D1EFB9A